MDYHHVQGALSSNPIGCKKIYGGNQTATGSHTAMVQAVTNSTTVEGCGLNPAAPTQLAFTTDLLRNNSATNTRGYLVKAPVLPTFENQGRHLLSTEISASPLASFTNVTGRAPDRSFSIMHRQMHCLLLRR